MKGELLRILREAPGYVSGQELCEILGVSRTAVWKTIKQLREQGYVIEAASTTKGVIKTQVEGRGWQGWCKIPYIDYLEEE